MKKLLNLKGATLLGKTEQRGVNGSIRGGYICNSDGPLVVCSKPSSCHYSNGSWSCV